MNREITKDEIKSIIDSAGLTVIKFYARWSGSCQMVFPAFEELAQDYHGKAKFYSININNDEALKKDFGVFELPTVLIFRDGTLADYISGAFSKITLLIKIENSLAIINN